MNTTNQPFLRPLIGLVIGLAIISAVLILFVNDDSGFAGKLVAISMFLFLYGITGSICWALCRRKNLEAFGVTGIIVAVLAFATITIQILAELKSESFWKFTFALFFLTIALAHISFLFTLTMRNKFANIARTVATIFISIFSVLLISQLFSFNGIEFFGYGNRFDATTFRIIGCFLILDLASTLLVALLNQLPSPTIELQLESKPVESTTDTPSDPFNPSAIG